MSTMAMRSFKFLRCHDGVPGIVDGSMYQTMFQIASWKDAPLFFFRLTEDEAIEALRSYSCFSRFIPVDCLRSLARSCFFREQCHPLYLRLKGTELRKKGRASFNDQKWKDLISESQCTAAHVNDTEQAVLQILGKSLDECSPFVQKVFIDLVTCELLADSYSDIESLIMLLRVLHYEQFTENAMRCQVLNVLEPCGD
ncbi:hypothetical protein L7F22_003679 [Adiantum nelumboides]|nr:hypothetical protein [Adiantum nelumboides]